MDTEKEHKHFYSHIDISYKYHEQEITEYNLIKTLLRLEKNENYDYLEREKEKLKKSQENNENITENTNDNKDVSIIDESDSDISDILFGFKKFNVKIYLMSGDTEALHKKKRFMNLFDIILLGFHSKNIMKELHLIAKENSEILIESNMFMTSFKKEEKKMYKEKLIDKMKEIDFVADSQENEKSSKGILKFVKGNKNENQAIVVKELNDITSILQNQLI